MSIPIVIPNAILVIDDCSLFLLLLLEGLGLQVVRHKRLALIAETWILASLGVHCVQCRLAFERQDENLGNRNS